MNTSESFSDDPMIMHGGDRNVTVMTETLWK